MLRNLTPILGTPEAEKMKRVSANGGYEGLRLATIRFGLLGALTQASVFQSVIERHITSKRVHILQTMYLWLSEATVSPTPSYFEQLRTLVISKLLPCLVQLDLDLGLDLGSQIVHLRDYCVRQQAIKKVSKLKKKTSWLKPRDHSTLVLATHIRTWARAGASGTWMRNSLKLFHPDHAALPKSIRMLLRKDERKQAPITIDLS